jgi:hypothetical protein
VDTAPLPGTGPWQNSVGSCILHSKGGSSVDHQGTKAEMVRRATTALVALMAVALALSGCGRTKVSRTQAPGQSQSQAAAADRASRNNAPKNYLASQSSDAQRAMDSMPAPTGGDQNGNGNGQ